MAPRRRLPLTIAHLLARWRSALERHGPVAGPPGDDIYHAFISYSHAVDGKLAPALQRGLQRFAKPWDRARGLRVFRDEVSLSADPGLWSSIVKALDAPPTTSFCSRLHRRPPLRGSRAKQHIGARRRPKADVLIALTEGELAWDGPACDFDWQRTNALPPTLSGVFNEEPRYVDLRWARSAEHLSLSHPRFRDAIAELAAPLYGLPKDEIAVVVSEEGRRAERKVAPRDRRVVALGEVVPVVGRRGVPVAVGGDDLAQSCRPLPASRRAASACYDSTGGVSRTPRGPGGPPTA